MADWRALYMSAVLETNPAELERLIRETEAALLERIGELEAGADGDGEAQDIADAAAALNVLKSERLGWLE